MTVVGFFLVGLYFRFCFTYLDHAHRAHDTCIFLCISTYLLHPLLFLANGEWQLILKFDLLNNLGIVVHYHNMFKKIVELHVIGLWFGNITMHEVTRAICAFPRPVQALEWSGPVITVEILWTVYANEGVSHLLVISQFLVFLRTDLFVWLLDPGHAISLWAGDCSGPLSAHIFCTVTCLVQSPSQHKYLQSNRTLFSFVSFFAFAWVFDLLWPVGTVAERVFMHLLIWASFLLADFL